MPLLWTAATAAASASSSRPRPPRLEFLHDLSNPSVQHFVENLKTACEGLKFTVVQHELTKALETSPGPCTFIAHCMEALVVVNAATQLEHLLTLSLDQLDDTFKLADDVSSSRKLVGRLFNQAVISGELQVDQRVLVKLVLVFGVEMSDVAADGGDVRPAVESFILKLVRNHYYTCAVSLVKHFGLEFECTGRDLLVTMVAEGQYDLAGRWAEHLGRDFCCFLVQQCAESKLHKVAYRLVRRYDLHSEFPDAFYVYRRSSLQKLVRKGLWEVAETIAASDRVLQEFLVSLALKKGLQNRAVMLCQAFGITDFDMSSVEIEVEDGDVVFNYIELKSVVDLSNVVWVDDAKGTNFAMASLCASQVVGFDCEWKPVMTKGTEPKASILQLATRDRVFVLDLITLSEEAPDELGLCMKSVFSSSEILKLGYAMHNDLELLFDNIPQLDGLTSCEMLLDLESFPDKPWPGGLSGLAKAVMGNHIDKALRMSNWAHRPLSEEQLHYAALDAAILVPIHEKLHSITDLGRSYSKSWKLKQKQQQLQKDDTTEMTETERLEPVQDDPNFKNKLRKLASAAGFCPPVYETVSSGPDHLKRFTSTVIVAGQIFSGSTASKKKESELSAAQQALEFLDPPAES